MLMNISITKIHITNNKSRQRPKESIKSINLTQKTKNLQKQERKKHKNKCKSKRNIDINKLMLMNSN